MKNRLVVAPLTIYDSGADGELTEFARRFWRDRFTGFSLFIMPFTNVAPVVSASSPPTPLTSGIWPRCGSTRTLPTSRVRWRSLS
ncbi:hypothetical protein [Actinomyces wuliandei]|uniref:hypothetical protein n=1 Tax=Actinomyces wuliandei TaxID=2057743 RepID=UPI001C5A0482|nr:hypothetical protein [Actinomyces wuliandei]